MGKLKINTAGILLIYQRHLNKMDWTLLCTLVRHMREIENTSTVRKRKEKNWLIHFNGNISHRYESYVHWKPWDGTVNLQKALFDRWFFCELAYRKKKKLIAFWNRYLLWSIEFNVRQSVVFQCRAFCSDQVELEEAYGLLCENMHSKTRRNWFLLIFLPSKNSPSCLYTSCVYNIIENDGEEK